MGGGQGAIDTTFEKNLLGAWVLALFRKSLLGPLVLPLFRNKLCIKVPHPTRLSKFRSKERDQCQRSKRAHLYTRIYIQITFVCSTERLWTRLGGTNKCNIYIYIYVYIYTYIAVLIRSLHTDIDFEFNFRLQPIWAKRRVRTFCALKSAQKWCKKVVF